MDGVEYDSERAFVGGVVMKNLDLFGNEVEVPDPPKGRRKTPTMQEMYGVTEGRMCGECVHCFGYRQSRVWYKCELWLKFFPGHGHSAASDIRKRGTACGRFEGEDKRE